MRARAIAGLLCLCAAPALAQQDPDGIPAFAPPGWLSDTITRPHANIATSALPQDITVMPLGAVQLDAVGLLPRAVTGLPPDLWGSSDPETLATLMRGQPTNGLPATLAFTQQLALAELDPPRNAGQDAELFLARIDLLLARGALEPARALIERAGASDPEVFRRWFDVSLLTGQPDRACATMQANPDIAPTFPARIFCLARSGDWAAAALSLDTGQALGYITQDEGDLIARFLDPELFEGEPPLPPDPDITPLRYQMRVALGERPPSAGLPLAFAQSDLAEIAGWRAQLDAAERLMRAGAIEPTQWLAIYTSRMPSASGGVWDRVAALQAFDAAILASDPAAVADRLPRLWEAMEEAHLEVAFASLYAERLLRLPLTGQAAMTVRRIGMLSSLYERVAQTAVPQTPAEAALFAIAQGRPARVDGRDPISLAVTTAFSDPPEATRYTPLLEQGRMGEALLRGALVLSGMGRDADDLADALTLFRSVGLEDVARRTALQLLILERA